MFNIKPIQDEWAKKPPTASFFPVKVGISHQNFLTFSFDSFATLS